MTKIERKDLKIQRADVVGLAVVMAAVLAGTYFLGQTILQNFPNSADEHAYLFQAQLFAEGRCSAAAHPQQEFLSPFFILTHNNRVFSIFPPGWPLVLSLGVRMGVPDFVNPCLAALTVPIVFMLGLVLFGRWQAWLSVFLTVPSPFFLFNAASYFSHPACLLGISLTALCLVLWERHERWWLAAGAGFAYAAAFSIRELTAVLVLSFPIAWIIWRSRFRWRFVLFFIVGTMPMAWWYLWYNATLTGHWFQLVRFLAPGERLGFGMREIRVFDYVEIQNYAPLDACRNLIGNLERLVLWTVPGLPLLAVWGAWRNRANGWAMVFSVSAVLLLLGYCLYPSDGGNQYGPRFYYECLIFLGLLASAGISVANWRKWLWGAIAIVLLNSALIGWHATSHHRQIYQRRTLYRLVDRRKLEHAVVFVVSPSGDMTQGDLIRNLPDPHEADVIYAWNLGQRNRELLKTMPDRTFFLFERDAKSNLYFLKRYKP